MNQRNQMRSTYVSMGILALALITTGCAKSDSTSTSATEDTSTSGSVASTVGGAYNGSSGSGTVATNDRKKQNDKIEALLASLNPIASARASTACPTFSTTSLETCITNGSASITYNDCSYGSSTATWTGSASIACIGTISNPTVTRSYANGTTRTNSFGTVLTIDSTGLSTYSGSGATVAGGGTTFTTSSISIGGVNLTAKRNGVSLYDHTITTGTTPLTLNAATKEVTGTVITYHNLVHATATSVIDVTFASGCCTPVSGTITTTFASSSLLGKLFNGATETLSFTACGQATYSGPEGTTGSVTLANCI